LDTNGKNVEFTQRGLLGVEPLFWAREQGERPDVSNDPPPESIFQEAADTGIG